MGSGIPSSHNNKPLPNPMGPPRFTFLKARSQITPADSAVAFDAGRPGCDQRASSTSRMMMGIGIPRSHNKIGMT